MDTIAARSSRKQNQTAQAIIALVRNLIQTKGFNAISYQDIAKTMAITKASVHYHFPTKADLGAAVVRDYHQAHRNMCEALLAEPSRDPFDKWTAYLAPFLEIAESGELVCLCGVLAGEYVTLPAEMQTEVTLFFESHLRWLTRLLEQGKQAGRFSFPAPAETMANCMLSGLQGALLLARAQKDPQLLTDLVAVFQKMLGQDAR